MNDSPRPLAVGPGEGPTIQGPAGGPLTFKVRGEQTGGRLTAAENVIAPGDGPPVHTHEAEDEFWWVIEGRLRFKLADEVAQTETGSFVWVPRGTPHAFQNIGDTPARLLVMFTPSGMERFFDEFAALPADASPADAFSRIGGPLGMNVVGPPLAAHEPR